jgi:hypothetical protein
VVFGSVTSSNDDLWRHAIAAGFDVVTVERGFAGKEKRVEPSSVTRVCRDAFRFGSPRRDRITPVASDGDYEPVVKRMVADCFGVTGLYWAHAGRVLREAATGFHSLDPYIADLALV